MTIETSEAARALGRISTERKAAAAIANLVKARVAYRPVELAENDIECTCGRSGPWREHKSICRRYGTMYQRERRSKLP